MAAFGEGDGAGNARGSGDLSSDLSTQAPERGAWQITVQEGRGKGRGRGRRRESMAMDIFNKMMRSKYPQD